MKIFALNISDEPKPRKKYRYGEIIKIVYNNGDEVFGGQRAVHLAGKLPVAEDLENIKKIVIEGHYQKKTEELYPNFLQIRWSFIAADDKARMNLDTLQIPYKSLDIEISNENNHSYKSIFFNEIPNLIAMKESNVYLSEEGYIRTIGQNSYMPFLSKLVLKKEALKYRGIWQLREALVIICDEETKEKLENSELTGFSFEELEVVA